MTERWTFGVDPLRQTLTLAPLLRKVAGLALALEAPSATVDRLIEQLQDAAAALTKQAPADLAPRVGAELPPDRRVYVDHSRDVASYNPCFPEYSIEVDGAAARGAVTFPLAFEGPPGIVHGGVLSTFFDCVIQHHNCDVGVAGKTTSLLVEYRRPTPVGTPLSFEVERETDDRTISSRARLLHGEKLLCSATMQAVAGDRARLSAVSPRREPA